MIGRNRLLHIDQTEKLPLYFKELQQHGFTPTTVGGNKGYHTEQFFHGLWEVGDVP